MDDKTVKLLREMIDGVLTIANLNGDQISKIYQMLIELNARIDQLESKALILPPEVPNEDPPRPQSR